MNNAETGYQRFLDGDKEAFAAVIEAYRSHLTYFIFGYVKNASAAEELAEDTFVELILHPHRYRRGSSLKTFLFAIGRNKAVNYVKYHARHPVIDFDELPELPDTAFPEEQLLQKEKYRELYAAMMELKEEYRTALWLVYFENMSNQDAARVMKKNRKQIENLLFRAKRSLQEKLGKEWSE